MFCTLSVSHVDLKSTGIYMLNFDVSFVLGTLSCAGPFNTEDGPRFVHDA